jgi:uncharacterized membrane protein
VIFVKNYSTNIANEGVMLTIGLVLLWLKLIQFVILNEYLGRFIGVVKNIIPEVILFFCLYLINIVFFSLASSVSMRDIADYKDFTTAFRTNFFSSFGNFRFDILEQA